MDLWVKSAHIVSVISWMAALLYLPRLMVYHCESEKGSVQSETFKVMERRLLKGIATPAMLATWVFGLWTAYLYSVWSEPWFIIKFFLVFILSGIHMMLAGHVRKFANDQNEKQRNFFRVINEVPAVFMLVIVVLVVVKPF